MSVYQLNGNTAQGAYDLEGTALSYAYDIEGNEVLSGVTPDYNQYSNEYQHAILTARDEWNTQYRADDTVIPLVLHTDQHGRFKSNNTKYAFSVSTFTYLGLAIKWAEVSAMLGLGDVDMEKAEYPNMNNVLNLATTRNKQINIWGNHDLWKNYTLDENDQFVVDFDTVYPCFSNETYGDVSHAYNHRGIEYHIDIAHNVKYVCIAGWEIDKAKGGYSHYNISYDSLEGVIDALEANDGYDIVILTHCGLFSSTSHAWKVSTGDTQGSDVFFEEPVLITSFSKVVNDVSFDQLIADRNNGNSGTITDSYGNVHSYDFSTTSGKVLCDLFGHQHCDGYAWSSASGIPEVCYDAFSYNTQPLYLINIDRTNERVDSWKITSDALVQKFTVPFIDPDLNQGE